MAEARRLLNEVNEVQMRIRARDMSYRTEKTNLHWGYGPIFDSTIWAHRRRHVALCTQAEVSRCRDIVGLVLDVCFQVVLH